LLSVVILILHTKKLILPIQKKTKNLPIERAWMDTFTDHGYIDVFRQFNKESDQYSWWTYRTNARGRNIGWRIDYFFVNNEFLPNLKNAFIMQVWILKSFVLLFLQLHLRAYTSSDPIQEVLQYHQMLKVPFVLCKYNRVNRSLNVVFHRMV